MLLTTTSDIVQVVTATAVPVDVAVEYADTLAGVVSVGRKLTKITTAATTTIVDAPAASTGRKVQEIQLQNVHASSSVLVTIQQYDGASTVVLESVTLLAGERIGYRPTTGYTVVGADGVDKLTGYPRASGAATVAQIAAHSADTYYLGLNVGGRLAAGAIFRWYIATSKGAAGVATPTFIIRTGTAGTTADTARLTMTGPAQTAVADTARIRVEATFRVVGASAVVRGDVQLSHNLAATGFAATGPAGEAHFGGTSGTFDSSPANTIVGLSVNPGAAGAWVTEQVTLDAINLLP